MSRNNVRVMARVNPKPGDVCLRLDPPSTIVPLEEGGMAHHHKFHFDHVFPQASVQEDVFSLIGRPTVDRVMEGYNGTVFAYGQTGSGKTHTMLAPEGGSARCLDPRNGEQFELRGLIPRMAAELFERLERLAHEKKEVACVVRVAYYEIYNEELIDLLQDEAGADVKIRLEGTKETFRINGLTTRTLTGPEGLLDVIQQGAARRHTASTNMNETSSRSHSVIQINVVQNDSVQKNVTTAQLNLVDLAGCESLGRTGATGMTAREGTKINLSLTTLGIVINQLCKGEKYISFRDSLLTRVLQNSLGGNAITTMIVTMSQLRINYSDTLSVLRFAERAKQIKNKARINKQRTAAEWELLFKQAEEEIESLKQRLALSSGVKSPLSGRNAAEEAKARLEMELEMKEEQALVLAEKERLLFAAEQKLTATAAELEEAKMQLEVVELDKNENIVMYETTLQNLKKLEQDMKQEQSAKAALQETIKELEVEMAGMNEELRQMDEEQQASNLQEVERNSEMRLKTEEMLAIKRDLAEKIEAQQKLKEQLEYERSIAKQSEESLKGQISSLKAASGDTTIEAAISQALDQQNGTLEMIKVENSTLREEAHELKQGLVQKATEIAAKTAELEQVKKQVEALKVIGEKSKATHDEMLATFKRNAQDNAALKQTNLALEEKIASEVAMLTTLTKNTEAERDNLQRELDALRDQSATCKANLEQAEATISSLNNRIREMELANSRLEDEAEKNREEIDHLAKLISGYTTEILQHEGTMAFVQTNLKLAAELVLENKAMHKGEKDEIMQVLNEILAHENKDILDKLAMRLHDEKAQHEIVGHVEVVMEQRNSDFDDINRKLKAMAKDGDVIPDSMSESVSFIQKQCEKVVKVLSAVDEFIDSDDECRRQDILPEARDLGERAAQILEQLQGDILAQSNSDMVICPFCQDSFPKHFINTHVNMVH